MIVCERLLDDTDLGVIYMLHLFQEEISKSK